MNKHSFDLDGPLSAVIHPSLGLVPAGLRELARHIDTEAGETLFRMLDPVRHIFLVLQGEVRLVRVDRRGAAVILQRSRAGFIAEASLDIRSSTTAMP